MVRRDLIDVYKITRGIDRVNSHIFIPRVGESRARGNAFHVTGRKNEQESEGQV